MMQLSNLASEVIITCLIIFLTCQNTCSIIIKSMSSSLQSLDYLFQPIFSGSAAVALFALSQCVSGLAAKMCACMWAQD